MLITAHAHRLRTGVRTRKDFPSSSCKILAGRQQSTFNIQYQSTPHLNLNLNLNRSNK